MRSKLTIMILVAAVAACGPSPAPSNNPPAADGWYEFQGSWNAAGSRHTISLGGDRKAGIIDLMGSMLLAGPSRPGVGFRAEAIALGDSATGVGRPRGMDRPERR